MPTVYVVNEPSNDRTPAGRAPYDTSAAEFFGQLVNIFRADENTPIRNRDVAIAHAHDVLADAEKGDFLVWAGGDPFGMVIVSAILADYTDGQFNYLVWDRVSKAYSPVPVSLFAPEKVT